MEYIDLPQEMEQEFLYNMKPEELVSHCLVHKRTFRICNEATFWINYTKNMNELNLFRLLNTVALKSQHLGRTLYSAIISKTKIPIYDVCLLLLMSVMRNDTETLDLLKTHYEEGIIQGYNSDLFDYENQNNLFDNMNTLIDNMNTLMDEISNSHARSFDAANNLNRFIPYNIIRIILRDRIEKSIISNISVSNLPPGGYELVHRLKFILAIVADTNNINEVIKEIVKTQGKRMQRSDLLRLIADYLPVSLYPQAEAILRDAGVLKRSMILADFIGGSTYVRMEDIDHLEEQLRFQYNYPELELDLYFLINGILPKNFIEIINKLPSKLNIIATVRDIHPGTSDTSKWVKEVLRLYKRDTK